MMTGTINGNGQGMHLYLSSPWQWYQYPYPEVSPHPPWQGHHNCSGYRLAAEWHFIQRNLQHRPIFLDSLSRHHLIKPRVSFNICPFVLSTSGHFIMPWVQLPFKGPEKSIIFCSRLGIIQCTDEDKLQEFQKPGYHFCVIKIFIFVKSKSSFRQYPHAPWPKQQYPYSTMHYGSIRCIKDFQDYKKLRLQFGSSLIKTVWDRLKIAQIFREKYLSKIW